MSLGPNGKSWLTTRKKHLFEAKGRWGTSPLAIWIVILGTGLGGALDIYNRENFAFLALALIFGSITFLALADRAENRQESTTLDNDVVQLQQKVAERVSQQMALLRGAAGLFAVNPAAVCRGSGG